MKFIYCVFLCGVLWSSPSHCLKKIRVGLGEPNSPLTKNVIDVEDKWFIQKLDHFNPTDNRTWKQRYQVNQKYYKKDGPVFLMIGGEGPISAKWMYSGAWINYAEEFNALCFQLEHRYYGKSHPTEDMSTKNLVYLSSEQALTDLAEFIVNIRTKYDIPATTKWIAFGGSYPGSLAAWLRMKFPHLVHAAVSSSGPLLAKIDFKEYFKVVENALATYSPECVLQIKQANQMIDSQIKTSKGAKIIENKFKLCDPLNINTKNDVENLFETLAGNFADIVQYNKDNRLYENPERSLVTLETLCDIMVNKTIITALDRYAEVNNKLLSINNLTCTEHVYKKMIDSYLNTSWNSDSAAGEMVDEYFDEFHVEQIPRKYIRNMEDPFEKYNNNTFLKRYRFPKLIVMDQLVDLLGRQWTYQTCTEFGFFQTSNQDDHVFGNQFPASFFIDMCSDIFGKLYNFDILSNGIKRSNIMYGELNIKENRVIYVHGSVDPWHALGITRTKSKNNVAIYIEGTAHCANMYPPSPTDLPQLKHAREMIRAFLNEWLTENDNSSEVDNIEFKYKV